MAVFIVVGFLLGIGLGLGLLAYAARSHLLAARWARATRHPVGETLARVALCVMLATGAIAFAYAASAVATMPGSASSQPPPP